MRVKILSVCTNLPTRRQATLGLFVARRLAGMAEHSDLRALKPEPWFPFLRPRRQDEDQQSIALTIDRRPVFYLPGWAKHLDGRWFERGIAPWVNAQARPTQGPLIVDAHFGYPEGVACFRIAKARDLPIFITMRGLEVDLFDHPRIGPQLIEALNGATGVIAVSHSLERAAIAAGVRAEQIHVIPNGVETEFYSPGDRDQARHALGVPASQRLIVCVGNLKKVKGHDYLIEALAGLESRQDLRLVCLGAASDPEWKLQLDQQVERLGLGENVDFAGSASPETVVQWLRAADVFALASRREGCCNALLEALAAGTPVCVTDVGDNRDFVDEGQSGFVTTAADPVALSEGLERSLAGSFDRQGIAATVAGLSWEGTATAVLSTFEGALAD